MEIVQLITGVDVRQHKQISESAYEETLNQYIKEAQFLDIQELLGANMYNDLLRNEADVKYTTLLDGGNYTYETVTYSNVGLKTVLVHFAYARYIKFGSFTDTPFSMIEKIDENSTPVSDSMKQTIYKNNQQIAHKYWANVKAYLDRNKATYPLWDVICTDVNKTFRMQKII